MAISIDPAFVLLVLLVSVRLSVLFTLSPVFAATGMPAMSRVGLVLGVSWLLASSLPGLPILRTGQFSDIVELAVSELLIGATLALGVQVAFSAFTFAGNLLDVQLGFAASEIVDPGSQERLPVIGSFLNLVAVAVFFAVDGHHMVLSSFAEILRIAPPGVQLDGNVQFSVIKLFGSIFSTGVLIAAPVLVALLLADIGFSVAARFLPQMNVFIVALSAKIMLGLALLFVIVDAIPHFARKTAQVILNYWEEILR